MTSKKIFTHDELWAAQLENYPQSIELTSEDMLKWADSGNTLDIKLHRFRSIALATQLENYVWYKTNLAGQYIGCRYGIKSNEYLSGYN
jgi:hypothetical protein